MKLHVTPLTSCKEGIQSAVGGLLVEPKERQIMANFEFHS